MKTLMHHYFTYRGGFLGGVLSREGKGPVRLTGRGAFISGRYAGGEWGVPHSGGQPHTRLPLEEGTDV